jgi:hypothetical protein
MAFASAGAREDNHNTSMSQFISEPLIPVMGTFDTAAMARGEPGVPRRFTWRKRDYELLTVTGTWKTSAAKHGEREVYLRRHWFSIATTDGMQLTIYCDRQAQRGKDPKRRWWVYSVDAEGMTAQRAERS